MRITIASIITILLCCFLFFGFKKSKNPILISGEGKTIKDRFLAPTGYTRIVENNNSFGTYLRNLPLKPSNSEVKYYNGSFKHNNNVYEAVIDLSIGNKNLHQCADAVMRLRADFFYKQKQYDKIHFNFTNGFRADYSKWRQGFRIAVKGNTTSWVKSVKPSDDYEDYWKYLEIIFNYAGTASLDKELKTITVSDLQIGDVFIKGGFPGHAMIVVDVAINTKNNKKVFLLAQSYMPAQELQIVKNPNNLVLSPWFEDNFGTLLQTPEWTFKSSELKRF
jgi:hypothetical protein